MTTEKTKTAKQPIDPRFNSNRTKGKSYPTPEGYKPRQRTAPAQAPAQAPATPKK